MSNRISSADFLRLSHHDSATSTLEVRFDLCSGRGDIWGGVALAAAMNALSHKADGRPVVYASAQFLANKANASELVLQIDLPVQGRSISMGVAQGRLDDVDFFRVNACLGQRTGADQTDWVAPVTVPAPQYCPEVDLGSPRTAMHSHTELRLAKGMFGVTGQGTADPEGILSMWVRMPEVQNDAGALTVLADYMLSGIGNALGKVAYGVSLDNTIRLAQLVPTNWIQCDITIEHIGNGFGYGTAHLFSETGVLMGTASQSVIVRVPAE